MVYSHCTGTGSETGQEPGAGSMVSNILCRNVHTDPRQRPGHFLFLFHQCRYLYCPGPMNSHTVWIRHNSALSTRPFTWNFNRLSWMQSCSFTYFSRIHLLQRTLNIPPDVKFGTDAIWFSQNKYKAQRKIFGINKLNKKGKEKRHFSSALSNQ